MVEISRALAWVRWQNNLPLLEPIRNVPPIDVEATFY
jgi:hypothetical protein